ncbi:hypothetical protein C3747_26g239 [Trypanosoma cruzi]|uniref:C2HC/C3H-type domain-containing protein n=2 Tax=Trypanosoma cruzi TaxID=5693 RepID=Q4DQ96_TRYCC|nr:hypothetical protein, conserved [Trypanosoma cruzi]EAN94686.1 hypothetical protein, conserved [Trypanosoma cruzi]PWV15948.1 hypothetical protein C3747_26g239 [Trypanosoma cruzi]RNC56731.1 hypothetical protein TcCL_ESM05690 [Trypanosoma cruzi]|eukprot:XP_816537.1 hypothetical protein [Trypanosoma cruzi strain CL Brener]
MPTATDFVQDYAAKRAAQMERARRIREERQQFQQQQQPMQQQQQQQPSMALSYSANSNSNSNSNNNSSGSGLLATTTNLTPAARSRRIANVVEEDFKRATKAGIITPDQARQLWAMLSDQIVQVENPGTSTLTSSSYNVQIGTPITQELSTRTRRFGNSISLDSLRASIAQFKEKQQREQEQQQSQLQDVAGRVGGNVGRARASNNTNEAYELATRVFAPPPASAVAGTAGAAISRPARRELRAGSIEHGTRQVEPAEDPAGGEEMNNWGLRRYESPRKGWRSKQQQQQQQEQQHAKKPEWNFDVDVGKNDKDDFPETAPLRRPSSRQQRGTGGGIAVGTPSRVNPPMQFDDIPVGDVTSTMGGEASLRPRQQQQQQLQSVISKVGINKNKMSNIPARPSVRSNISLDDVVVGGSERGKTDTLVAPPPTNEPLMPCGLCGRSFRASILARHESACSNLQKKRRVFDTKEQRLEGIEGIREVTAPSNSVSQKGGKKHPVAVANTNSGKPPKWKIQHEQFQAAMRAMRQVNVNAPSGGGGGKQSMPASQPMPEAYDDRVPCPHCGRKFAELTAQRHIPKCMTTIARPKGIRPTRR